MGDAYCTRILLKLWFIFLFFAYFLEKPISENISYLKAASKSIVSNILIIKRTKKIFSFSQKHVAKNKKFLSENLKAKAKWKNMKSHECYENVSEKKNYFFIFIYVFGWKCPTPLRGS